MERKCRIEVVKIKKSGIPGDFYFSWKIIIFRQESSKSKYLILYPCNINDEYREYISFANALVSAKNIAKGFGLKII
jgi:hypothetical protein